MKLYRDESSARICPVCKWVVYLTFSAVAAEYYAGSCFQCGHCKNWVTNEDLQKAQKREAVAAVGGAA